MNLEHDFNIVEAGLWFFLAIATIVHRLRATARLRPILLALAVTLAVFGGSDIVESRTGAWWTPWWLLGWKAICVLVLFFLFKNYFRLKKQSEGKD